MRISFLTITLLTLLDQGSKVWVRQNVDSYQVTPLLPNFLELTFVQNKGVSFSFLSNLPDATRIPLLLSVSGIAVLGMLYYLIRYWRVTDHYMKIALVWIIPGALGNLIDRAIFGSVTDFLHFRWYDFSFFVNNLADCFISVGVVFFIVSTLFGKEQDVPNSKHSSKTSSSAQNR
ncbi:MAG: signal peptidase II [SAR324 cluster bacterium]|nr:signal peptidase II [SAR324 cluster bacterium]